MKTRYITICVAEELHRLIAKEARDRFLSKGGILKHAFKEWIAFERAKRAVGKRRLAEIILEKESRLVSLEDMETGERVAALIAAGWTREEASAIVGAEEAGEIGIEPWRYEDQKAIANRVAENNQQK